MYDGPTGEWERLTDIPIWKLSKKRIFVNKTEKEVLSWAIAGRTVLCCNGRNVSPAILADTWLTVYAFTVIVIWVLVYVAWWWWASNKNT